MPSPYRIHVFGASGSGTTTLGAALAERLGILHLDVDDFYWKKSDPPFLYKNSPDDRVAAIQSDIAARDEWVLSGSLVSWGAPLVGEFTLAVFVELEPTTRMQRLYDREVTRNGARIEPGGDMREAHLEFMAWARRYDTDVSGVRCRTVHVDWMNALACRCMSVNGAKPTASLVAEVLQEV